MIEPVTYDVPQARVPAVEAVLHARGVAYRKERLGHLVRFHWTEDDGEGLPLELTEVVPAPTPPPPPGIVKKPKRPKKPRPAAFQLYLAGVLAPLDRLLTEVCP